jgi:hypothetical protein
LVLHWSDTTTVNPVEGVGNVCVGGTEVEFLSLLNTRDDRAQVNLSKFLLGKIEEFGLSEHFFTFFSVHFLDVFVVVVEHPESVVVFKCGILPVIFVFEFSELGYNFFRDCLILTIGHTLVMKEIE